MVVDGCDIVDIGAESTRPEAEAIDEAEELARLDRVIAEFAALDVPVSIDTTKSAVAARALSRGAVLVNDVWGLQKDPRMADTVAEAEAAVVIMHNRAEKDKNLDIIADIRRFFERSLSIAARAGIPKQRTILDVGIGFAKTSRQNRDAIVRLSELNDYGLPIMVGASRKRFLGSLTGDGVEGDPGWLRDGKSIRDYRRRRNPACTRRRGACRRAAGPSGDARHVACSSAKRRKPNSFHLRQSVSCFSSMVKIAPSLTSISRTMHMRPVLSMSLTS
ncbi:MAG: dihydropteroate synthase [Pseudolabrys sp.]